MRRSVATCAGVLIAFLLVVSGAAGMAVADHEPGHVGGSATGAGNESGNGSSFSDTVSSNASNESDGSSANASANESQPDRPDAVPDGATTPEGLNSTGNQTGNESGNASSGDSGSWADGLMPSTPSLDPKQWLLDMIEGAYEDLRGGIVGFVNEFNFVFTGVPAPGSPTDILSWMNPPEPEWEVSRNLYMMMVGLMTPFLTLNMMQAFGMDNRQRREEMFRENLVTLFMYGAGWFIVAAMCHITNEWTQALTPAGEEFVASPEGLGQLGVGIIIGAAVAKVNIIVLLIGILLVMLVWFLVLFTASTWPMWWTMRSSGFPMLRTWGNYMITTFCIVLLVRGTQALGLRFLFHLPFSEVGPGSTLLYVVVTAMGLWFLLYKLLRVAIEKTAAASAFTLGMSYLPKKFSAAQAIQSSKSAAKNTAQSARQTASTVRHAPQKIREAPGRAKKRVQHAVPNRLGGKSPPPPSYSGSSDMRIRSKGSPTGASGSNPSTSSKQVRADGGVRSDAKSSRTAGSGKRRMRLQRNDDGSYEAVDK